TFRSILTSRADAFEGAGSLWRGYKKLAQDRPTLILRGALSDILTAATLQRMITCRPTAMSASITEVGHAPTLDEPDARAALAAFFTLAP
ncbi:MAG TPA: hypothetical protein PLK37_10070, partial [Terricaulis sp.]|nr:hypothetical protein [Terricaulis sp.]